MALTVRERPGCWTLAFGSKPRRALYEVQAGRQPVLVLGHVAAADSSAVLQTGDRQA